MSLKTTSPTTTAPPAAAAAAAVAVVVPPPRGFTLEPPKGDEQWSAWYHEQEDQFLDFASFDPGRPAQAAAAAAAPALPAAAAAAAPPPPPPLPPRQPSARQISGQFDDDVAKSWEEDWEDEDVDDTFDAVMGRIAGHAVVAAATSASANVAAAEAMTSLVCDGETDVHVSAFAWRNAAWRLRRAQRQFLIAGPGRLRRPVTAFVLAVVQLQRFWRGIVLRRRVLSKYIGGAFRRRWQAEEAAVLARYHGQLARASESAFALLVRRVQSRWRCVAMRREHSRWDALQAWPVYWVAAATIQRAWVDHRFLQSQQHYYHHRQGHPGGRRQLRTRARRWYATRADAAAGRIQLQWRGCINQRIFRFYVSLIRFRERGDPALMLKCIAPGEAAMMDPAAGLHVRFRLGGASFPPRILFKVFTHNNVADIGSFAPRNYAARRPAPARHNKPPCRRDADTAAAAATNATATTLGAQGPAAGRYRRVDNNPWRPVDAAAMQDGDGGDGGGAGLGAFAARLAASATATAAATSGGAAGSGFHFSRLRRRQDRDARSKRKRRAWLAELYASEQIRQLSDAPLGGDNGAAATIRRDATAIFDGMAEAEVDDEVRRLAQWTACLDFERYRSDWLRTATTAASDAAVS